MCINVFTKIAEQGIVCVHAYVCLCSFPQQQGVDKWPNGIDFNFENAALNFSLYDIVGTWGGSRAALPKKTYY